MLEYKMKTGFDDRYIGCGVLGCPYCCEEIWRFEYAKIPAGGAVSAVHCRHRAVSKALSKPMADKVITRL